MLKKHFIKPHLMRLTAFAAKTTCNTFLAAKGGMPCQWHDKMIQSFYREMYYIGILRQPSPEGLE